MVSKGHALRDSMVLENSELIVPKRLAVASPVLKVKTKAVK